MKLSISDTVFTLSLMLQAVDDIGAQVRLEVQKLSSVWRLWVEDARFGSFVKMAQSLQHL